MIELYEYLERLGYNREMIKPAKEPKNTGYFYTVEAFERVLFYVTSLPPNILTFDANDIVVAIQKKSFQWFQKSKLLKSILPKPFSDFCPTIVEVHDRIFKLLSKKYEANNNFLFRMRSRNNKKRYEKGYWFLGNDVFLVLSFWAGTDWKNKTPNIWIGFNIETGHFWIEYVGRTNDATAIFLKNLATVNGLIQTKVKGEERMLWRKNVFFNWQGDYIKAIEKFIQTEKVIIDTFLKAARSENQNLGDFDFLDKKDFKKLYTRIQKLRKQQNTSTEVQTNIDYKNTPIVLKWLKLENIGHFVELELDLNYRVICLFGLNGIGKTTVLRALLLGLTGVDETSEIDSENLQQLLKIKQKKNDSAIQYEQNGKIELTYYHGEAVQNIIRFTSQKNGTISITDDTGMDDGIASFTATYDNGFYTQLILGFAQVHGRKIKKDNDKDLGKAANVRDILPLLNDEEDNRFEDLAEWIISLYGDAKVNERPTDLLILETIFDVVSKITMTQVHFDKVHFKNKLIWVTLQQEANDKPEQILFSLLSQGYRNVFAWVGYFIKRLAEANNFASDFKERPAIVVIDEIDTYLHPQWQRNILNVLAKNFKKTQFIVTTHSPLVANHLEVENKTVYILKEKGYVESVKYVQGVNLRDAFYNWMQIPFRDSKTQAAIQELFELINDDKLIEAKEKYDILVNQLGENDGDLFEAKTEIELLEAYEDIEFENTDFKEL